MTAAFVIRKGTRPTASFIRRIGRGTSDAAPCSILCGNAGPSRPLQRLALNAPFGGTRHSGSAGPFPTGMREAKPFSTSPESKSSTGTGGGFGSSTPTSSGAASGGSSVFEDATVKQAYAEGIISDKKGRYDFNAIGVFLLCTGAVGGGFYGLYRLVAHYVSPNEKNANRSEGNRKGKTIILPAEKNSPEDTPKELHMQRNLLKNKEAPHPAVMQAEQPPPPPK